MVESLGHEAHVVADGEEAEAACRRFGPYLVLMDLEMPRMNGIEATRRLLSLARIGAIAPCRVMMCTSVTDLRPLRLAGAMNQTEVMEEAQRVFGACPDFYAKGARPGQLELLLSFHFPAAARERYAAQLEDQDEKLARLYELLSQQNAHLKELSDASTKLLTLLGSS